MVSMSTPVPARFHPCPDSIRRLTLGIFRFKKSTAIIISSLYATSMISHAYQVPQQSISYFTGLPRSLPPPRDDLKLL